MSKLLQFWFDLKNIFHNNPSADTLLERNETFANKIWLPANTYSFNSSKLIFPELPILNKINHSIKYNKPNLKNYLLVAGQHILNSTGSLLEWLIKELGLPAENIYLIGKPYSTAKKVLHSIETNLKIYCQKNSRQIALGGFSDSYDTDITLLWNKLFIRVAKDFTNNKPIDGIFVLDDGGHLFKKIPADLAYLLDSNNNPIPLIGIEQTASGINASKKFPHPIIEVATSAAKRLESPMLAKVTIELLQQLEHNFSNYYLNHCINKEFKLSDLTVGIVGLGNVGLSTMKYLKQYGMNKLIVFDYDHHKKSHANRENVYFAKNILELLQNADLILGCTGTDFMSTDQKQLAKCIKLLENHVKDYPKILISLSSKDIEFNSLLNQIHAKNRNNRVISPLEDIVYPREHPKLIIISGGTPFNFIPVHQELCDYSIPLKEIQLVRGLLAVAILQAHEMMKHIENRCNINPGQYQLDPGWQSFIVNSWLEITKQGKNIFFDDLHWIARNSGGILLPRNIKQNLFKG